MSVQTPVTRRRAQALLLPMVRELLTMQASGYRGPRWRALFARLKTTADLIEESDDA